MNDNEVNQGGAIHSVEKKNSYLFVSLGSVGMFVFDISDIAKPELVGDFKNIDATYMRVLYSNGSYDSFIGAGGYSSSIHRIYFIRFSGL